MKNLNFISRLLIFAGCAVLLGTAGASDLDTITFKGIISGILSGTALIISGKIGLSLCKAAMYKTAKRKNIYRRNAAERSDNVSAGKTIQKLPRKRPFAA